MAKTHVYRIRVTRHTSGSFFATECYYEPTPLRAAERATLTDAGWSIRQSRVCVDTELSRLGASAQSLARRSAAAIGASSDTHALALHSVVASNLTCDVLDAADGRGTLRSNNSSAQH